MVNLRLLEPIVTVLVTSTVRPCETETETESPSSTNRDRVRPALAVKIMFQVTVIGTQIVRFLLARSAVFVFVPLGFADII
jgi:hypothetical protein